MKENGFKILLKQMLYVSFFVFTSSNLLSAVIEYNANDSSVPPNPTAGGWTLSTSGSNQYYTGVEDDGGTETNAWRIYDAGNQSGDATSYVYTLSDSDVDDPNGWTLTVKARCLYTDGVAALYCYFGVWDGSDGWELNLINPQPDTAYTSDTNEGVYYWNGTGDPAKIKNMDIAGTRNTGTSYPGAPVANEFQDDDPKYITYQMIYIPDDDVVECYADHENIITLQRSDVINRTSKRIVFGSGSSAGRGDMLVNYICFEKGKNRIRYYDPRLIELKLPLSRAATPCPIIEDPYGDIVMSYQNKFFYSGDQGQTWTNNGSLITPSANDITVPDPQAGVLLQSNDVNDTLVFVYIDYKTQTGFHWAYPVGANPPSGIQPAAYPDKSPYSKRKVRVIRSLDSGDTWQDDQALHDGYCGALQEIFQTSTGRIIVPVQDYKDNPGRIYMQLYYSDNSGSTWAKGAEIELSAVTVGHTIAGHHDGPVEPSIVEIPGTPNQLQIYIRTNEDYLYRSTSTNNGLTWSNPTSTGIEASSSNGVCKRLDDGRLMLIYCPLAPEGKADFTRRTQLFSYNPASWHRSELWLRFSSNNGSSWSWPTVIARGKNDSWQTNLYVDERRPGEFWARTTYNLQWPRGSYVSPYVANTEPFQFKIFPCDFNDAKMHLPLENSSIDYTLNGYDGTLSGNAQFVEGNDGISYIALDDTGALDGVLTGYILNPGTEDKWTAMATIYFEESDGSYPLGSDAYYPVIEQRISGVSDRPWLCIMQDGDIACRIDWGSGWKEGGQVPINQWAHVAVRYDNGELSLWVNGNKTTYYNYTPTSISEPMYFGRRHSVDQNWNGRMRDIRIYDRALSDAELEVFEYFGI